MATQRWKHNWENSDPTTEMHIEHLHTSDKEELEWAKKDYEDAGFNAKLVDDGDDEWSLYTDAPHGIDIKGNPKRGQEGAHIIK